MLLICNIKQFQRFFEQVVFVVAIALWKPLGAQPMEARSASVMLRT